MFESTPCSEALSAATLTSAVQSLLAVDRDLPDADRVDQIRLLEQLKAAAAGAQALLTRDFAESQRTQQVLAKVPARRVGQGIAAQVALARRESPARGSRFVGLAQALTEELPETFRLLRQGEISEWRAMLVARETACLDPELRRTADQTVARRLPELSDRETETTARAVAYRLDPATFTQRSAREARERRVTLRPAPTTMTRLSALLPVAQGVAVLTALGRSADAARAAGDERSRSQLMADLLVQRVTGQGSAAAVPVEILLLMTDATLFGASCAPSAPDATSGSAAHEAAEVINGGPVPAAVARDLVRNTSASVRVRHLFVGPAGDLIGMESRSRTFPAGLRTFLVARDRWCRTPWCGAAIRHVDHVLGHADGGQTRAANGQGLCEACNYAKQAPGWQSRPGPAAPAPRDKTPPGEASPDQASAGDAGRVVETRTPTGHAYRSRPPLLPGYRDVAGRDVADPATSAAASGGEGRRRVPRSGGVVVEVDLLWSHAA